MYEGPLWTIIDHPLPPIQKSVTTPVTSGNKQQCFHPSTVHQKVTARRIVTRDGLLSVVGVAEVELDSTMVTFKDLS
jgi:hypothetical protein